MVYEILKRGVGPEVDPKLMRFLGAVAVARLWCYPVWNDLLASEPSYRAVATDIFRHYPESGCLEALAGGPRPEITDGEI